MDRLREEVKRLLLVSGYKGMEFLHYYLKPFKAEAIKEGFTPEQIDQVIDILVDEHFAERQAW